MPGSNTSGPFSGASNSREPSGKTMLRSTKNSCGDFDVDSPEAEESGLTSLVGQKR